MRLITRSDFDGLACGALLLEAKVVDSWMFAHPKDIQDGLIPVTENDVLANVPFAPGCGLWFDHHSSEEERLKIKGHYKGESRISPSAARIIYEYYGGKERFPNFDDLMLVLPVRLSHFMRLLISLVIFRLTLACWLFFVRFTARSIVK